MARAASISVAEISKAAKSSVDKALIARKAIIPTIPTHRLGFIPPQHWFGFILSDKQFEKMTFGDAQKLAVEVHSGISASVAGAKGGKPGFVMDDGHLTIGFAPPIEVIFEA